METKERPVAEVKDKVEEPTVAPLKEEKKEVDKLLEPGLFLTRRQYNSLPYSKYDQTDCSQSSSHRGR